MSIENITARILEEAKAEAEAVLGAAREEADKLMAEVKKEAETSSAAMAKKAVNDAKILKERKSSVAELEGRKMILAAKQELIEQSFAEAKKELALLPEEEYISYLLEGLKGFEKGEVLLSGKDRAALGEKLAARLPEGLSLSEETADIDGGFILRDGNISLNGSLEAVLNAGKKELTGKVAGILFT